MKIQKLQIAIVSAAMGMALQTKAQSVNTEYVDIAPSSAGISSTITFDIPEFNPSLGTLNSVDLTLTPTFGDFGSEALNLTSSPLLADPFTVSDPSGSLESTALGLTASWSSSDSENSPNYIANAGPFVVTAGPALLFSFNTSLGSVAVGPAGFTGVGNYDLVVTGSGTANSSGDVSGLGAGWYGNVGGNLEVDYNFTPVPEPTTLALACLGGLAALVVTRRRS